MTLFPTITADHWRSALQRKETNQLSEQIKAEALARAHQYLYYVKCQPVLTDEEYDKFCVQQRIHPGGGSDRAADYPPQIIELAEILLTTKLTTSASKSKR